MKKILILVILSIFIFCNQEQNDVQSEQHVNLIKQNHSIKGFYILNQGGWKQNRASLDFYDFESGIYRRNIYDQSNPETNQKLGDTANDIMIYGSKIYVVLNGSNKIEVLDKNTNKKIRQINIMNPRKLESYNGKIYVSSYNFESQIFGSIIEIDSINLQITKSIVVGRQPEKIKVFKDKLYVANSGAYTPDNYDDNLSIINLNDFTKIKDVKIDINLQNIEADSFGNLYISSAGNYSDIKPKLFIFDTKTNQIKKTFNIAASNFALINDLLYIIGTDYNSNTNKTENIYNILDTKKEILLNENFIKDNSEKNIINPYGITIDPITNYIYITDAKDYIEPGRLFAFNKNGNLLFSVRTGDIPNSFAFLYK